MKQSKQDGVVVDLQISSYLKAALVNDFKSHLPNTEDESESKNQLLLMNMKKIYMNFD